jgi:hypothetical protein
MRLIDNLRNAEKKGMASVRRQMERAKDELTDVERRIRQRMRVYPQKLRNRLNAAGDAEMEPAATDQALAAVTSAPGAKPIITVNGRDVPEHESDKNIA